MHFVISMYGSWTVTQKENFEGYLDRPDALPITQPTRQITGGRLYLFSCL